MFPGQVAGVGGQGISVRADARDGAVFGAEAVEGGEQVRVVGESGEDVVVFAGVVEGQEVAEGQPVLAYLHAKARCCWSPLVRVVRWVWASVGTCWSGARRRGRPGRAAALRAELTEMLPFAPVVSLLIELDKHTGFLDCFTHAGGKQARSNELTRNLIAVILREPEAIDD
ncbi:hypothetical protein ACWDKQ_35055 [Saccharopolyspora sp. NPDC000995]